MRKDPLIAALIAKLPKPGESWTADQQVQWLHLMAMAFGTVYGGDAAQVFGGKNNVVPFQPVRVAKPVHAFVIDEAGFVKNAKGKRILPKDVTGPIFDQRGHEGDVRDIVWADDSRGLNGADLTISA